EKIDLRRIDAIAIEQAPRDLLRVLDRELEDRRPFLLDVMQAIVDRLPRRGHLAAAGRHAQGGSAAAVDLAGEIKDRRLPLRGWREHHRADALAEEHARRAIGVI